ncbi:hypothetical protein U1Q18_026750 [Sarracenia purpurea var. burkii]
MSGRSRVAPEMMAQATKKRWCAVAMESSSVKARREERGDVAGGRCRGALMVRARWTAARSPEGDVDDDQG